MKKLLDQNENINVTGEEGRYKQNIEDKALTHEH